MKILLATVMVALLALPSTGCTKRDNSGEPSMGTSSGERRMDSGTNAQYGTPGNPNTSGNTGTGSTGTTGSTGAGTGVERTAPSDTRTSPGATGNSTGAAGQ